MPTTLATPWRGFVLRFALALLVLSAAAAGVRLLNGVVPGQLEMILAGALAILVPGWALAGALALDEDRGPVTAWGLVPLLGVAVWIVPGGAGLLIGVPLVAIAVVVGVIAALCLAAVPPLQPPPLVDSAAIVTLSGLAAIIGWQWQSILIGDALFHAGVIRKLLALSRPDERNIWQFKDGYPHAGYAFPLLHLPEAAAIRIAGVDVSIGYADLAPLFALMLPVVAYAVGHRVAGRLSGLITAILALWVTCTGGQIISTGQQPRYYVTLVVLPAILLLVLEQVRRRSAVIEVLLVAGVLVMTFCHLTYDPPLWIALVVVSCFNPQLWRATIAAIGSSMVFVALIYLASVHGSGHSTPVLIPPGNFWALGGHRVALSGYQVWNHRAESVLALVAVVWGIRRPRTPLGILAILSATIFLICTIPGVTPAIGVLVGEGQSQRYAEMIPWAYVAGPAIVLVARSRNAVLAIAVAAIASLFLQRTHLLYGNPATVISSAGALVVIASAVEAIARSRRRRRPSHEYHEGNMAAPILALVLGLAVLAGSISVHGHTIKQSITHGRPQPFVGDQPTPQVLTYLRSLGQPLPVVLAPFVARPSNYYSGLAYELVGGAPVYAAAISSFHSQAERKDQPAERRRDVARYLRKGTSQAERHQIIERWQVDYVALDLKRASPEIVRQLDADPGLERVFTDDPQSSTQVAQMAVWKVVSPVTSS